MQRRRGDQNANVRLAVGYNKVGAFCVTLTLSVAKGRGPKLFGSAMPVYRMDATIANAAPRYPASLMRSVLSARPICVSTVLMEMPSTRAISA